MSAPRFPRAAVFALWLVCFALAALLTAPIVAVAIFDASPWWLFVCLVPLWLMQ